MSFSTTLVYDEINMNTKRLFLYQLITKVLPPTRCYGLKASLLRWCGAKIGNNVRVVSSAKIVGDMDLIVGDNVFIGHDTLVFGTAGSTINIESNTIVGSRVIIVTGSHEFTPDGPCIEGPGISADVTICSGAAISTGSIILPGKTVNRMAHVAAGSVVTHDVPEFTRVAGVPARIIKNFNDQ